MTPKGLLELRDLKLLHALHVSGLGLDAPAVKELQKALPRCRIGD